MAAVKYHALGPLMSGAGSRAFLGLRIAEGKAEPVVLVWVPEHVAGDKALTAQVKRETEIAVSLQHPNVIRVHGLTETDEGLARAVEYADGESLRRVLEVAGKLPPRFAARVVADAAAGVHFAHVHGDQRGAPLVHGDLRPETLLVTYAGVTKVSGYGALSVAPKEQGGKRVMGRRNYTAPEQLIGGRDAVNRQTDVFLLGLILFEALTAKAPFSEDENFEKAVLEKELRLDDERIPEPLRPVIAKATAKKGVDRYETAFALYEALQLAMAPLPSAAEFAAQLKELFKDDEARIARQREIETGIGEWRNAKDKKHAPAPKPAPSPAPAPKAAAPAAAAPAPAPKKAAAPKKAQSAPAARAPEAYQDEPSQVTRRPGNGHSFAIGVLLAIVAAGAFLAWWRSTTESSEVSDEIARAAARARANAEHAAQAAAGPAPEAKRVAAEPPPPPVAAAAEPKAPPPESRPEPPRPSAGGSTSLDLRVTPAVDVVIDGKPAGRAPLKLALAPGRHKVVLRNASLGINATRTVVVGSSGTTVSNLELGKGAVTINAPDGARVFIDGKPVGVAPLKGEVPVYEGSHQILVQIEQAKWKQNFALGAGEKMSFDVESTAE